MAVWNILFCMPGEVCIHQSGFSNLKHADESRGPLTHLKTVPTWVWTWPLDACKYNEAHNRHIHSKQEKHPSRVLLISPLPFCMSVKVSTPLVLSLAIIMEPVKAFGRPITAPVSPHSAPTHPNISSHYLINLLAFGIQSCGPAAHFR